MAKVANLLLAMSLSEDLCFGHKLKKEQAYVGDECEACRERPTPLPRLHLDVRAQHDGAGDPGASRGDLRRRFGEMMDGQEKALGGKAYHTGFSENPVAQTLADRSIDKT
jgi:hypothetical protein